MHLTQLPGSTIEYDRVWYPSKLANRTMFDCVKLGLQLGFQRLRLGAEYLFTFEVMIAGTLCYFVHRVWTWICSFRFDVR